MNKQHDKQQKIVYIVHSIDTEGPLYESLEATFERVEQIFGVRLKPTKENLRKLRNQEIDLGGKEALAAEIFSEHNLSYNDSWQKLDEMLNKIMSEDFRYKVPDSFGGGWVFNWHCVDLIDYETNPRKRAMGMHVIFDYYQEKIKKTGSWQDAVHFHFHPMSIYKEGNRGGSSYINSPQLYEILCRRIIERQWFPKVFRPGFHTERPFSHWFLEQWIPFDIANINSDVAIKDQQNDQKGGRFGDWRLAPKEWVIYHPSHDCYQLEGNCRRWIARILNLRSRVSPLTQNEVDKAFARANEGKPTLMGVANHDIRDMASEINDLHEMVAQSRQKYPEVQFKYVEAVEAFRHVLYGPDYDFGTLELNVRLTGNRTTMLLEVDTVKGKIFGPQPFLAVKTKSGRFIHENLDFDPSLTRWTYTFDQDSIHAHDVSAIGVASNDQYANSFVKVINLEETPIEQLSQEATQCHDKYTD